MMRPVDFALMCLALSMAALASMPSHAHTPEPTFEYSNVPFGGWGPGPASTLGQDQCTAHTAGSTFVTTPPYDVWAPQTSPVSSLAVNCANGGEPFSSGGSIFRRPIASGACPTVDGVAHEYQHATMTCVHPASTVDCAGNAGKVFDYHAFGEGAVGAPNLDYVCWNGGGGACRAKVLTASRFNLQLADGTNFNTQDGVAEVMAEVCPTGTAEGGSATLRAATETGATGTSGAIVAGGAGTAGGDSLNIARTASNTDAIARLLAGGSLGGGGEVTGTVSLAAGDSAALSATKAATEASKAALDGLLAGQCGGTGQPACRIDEGATQTSMQTGVTSIGDLTAQLDGAMKAQEDGLKVGSLPTFGSPAERWTLSFLPFLAATGELNCKTSGAPVVMAGKSMNIGAIDMCPASSQLKDVLYWLLAITTIVAMWAMVYKL